MTVRIGQLLQVTPGNSVDLAQIDPRSTPGFPTNKDKAWAKDDTAAYGRGLAEDQERLYASTKVTGDRDRVLLVLQAMDCGGKDGAMKRVGGALNPAGLKITSFGVPTEEERSHDFLWRINNAVPSPGYVGIFNRSHYEDVLVVRVHGLVPEGVWRPRYEQINQFEAELAADGVRLIKCMLHVSREEQHERLAARLEDPTKYWKYNPKDLDDRKHWTDFQDAYAEALQECSTEVAPWHVIPADRKWYRDWAITRLVAETFAEIDPQYPEPDFDVDAERKRLVEED